MRKLVCILLISVMAFGLFGCSSSNNELFTDEFFEGVVEIKDLYCGKASGEEMKSIILYLKSLKLTETDKRITETNERGEPLDGIDCIVFVKNDGSEVVLLHGHSIINGLNNNAYVLADENENFIAGLKEAFKKAQGEK